jgi:hypothetical protein
VLIVVKGWEPPRADLVAFVRAVREALDAGQADRAVWVAMAGHDADGQPVPVDPGAAGYLRQRLAEIDGVVHVIGAMPGRPDASSPSAPQRRLPGELAGELPGGEPGSVTPDSGGAA